MKTKFFLAVLIYISTAELVILRNLKLGFLLHSLFLIGVPVIVISMSFEDEISKLLMALSFLPLMRILEILLPLDALDFLERIMLFYSLLFVALVLFYRSFGGIGKIFRFKGSEYLSLGILFGIALGFLEYLILKPEVVEPINTKTLSLSLAVFFLTGLTEETLFRGFIQNFAQKLFSKRSSLIYANLAFVIVYISFLNPLELLFVFTVGMIIGKIYQKTLNLFLVSVIHGSINFCLFVVAPILFAS
ncbi:MAG: CPBP family intramembrane glutamic endopeptidase [Candidatus Methanofastidiosia archaeon]